MKPPPSKPTATKAITAIDGTIRKTRRARHRTGVGPLANRTHDLDGRAH